MTCEIKNTVTRPNGPYGDVMLQGYCATHDFRVFEGSIHGKLCPIGQIEAATAKALAQILAMAGPRDPATENVASEPYAISMLKAAAAVPPPKRPRKPKPTEE